MFRAIKNVGEDAKLNANLTGIVLFIQAIISLPLSMSFLMPYKICVSTRRYL